MTKPTPPVPARRRSPFTRLLLAAGLLLPAALHAQVPSPFPLKGAGVPYSLEEGELRESNFNGIGDLQNVVELTSAFALLSDGRVIRAVSNRPVEASNIISLAEVFGLRLLLVNADNRLEFKGNPDETLPSFLASLTDAVSVEFTESVQRNLQGITSLGYGLVFRKNGQVTGYEVKYPFALAPLQGGGNPRKGKVASAFPGLGFRDLAVYSLVNGKITQSTYQDTLKRIPPRVVATDAYGVFLGRGVRNFNDIAVAILKPKEIAVTEGGDTKTTKPGAVAPREGSRSVRASQAAAAVNPLENESAVFFGRSPTGMTSTAHRRTFTITNNGQGAMTLGAVTVDGDHPGDFAVTQPAVPSLGRSESVDFTVQFTPGADGERTATLHVASNDEDETSFDLDLTGFGQATQATPAAVVDTLTAPAGGETTFTKLLANDTDADTDPLKIVSVAAIDGTTGGFVEFDPATGLVAYTSPPDVGTDSFEYTITDGTVTQTGTVNVNLVDPVPLAASKTFQGAEDGESVSVTFGKLSPAAAAARKARVRGSTSTGLGPKLIATFTEQIGGRTYKGKTSFDADDNAAQAVLNGSEDNATARFEVSVDEDGNPLVFANGLTLRPDVFDRKHPAPPEIVGTYTMSLPGASLDGFFDHAIGDSVASVTLAADGSVKIAGVMADGQPFTGKAQLDSDRTAPFNLPLYKGKARGSFSGEIDFVGSDAPDGSLAGHATWTKPPGIANLPESEGFSASGELVGGFYTPDELPTNAIINYAFGTDGEYTNFIATGAGPLSAKFTLSGQLADTTAFTLDSKLTLKTGLILGKRGKKETTGPKSFSGVILMEQEKIVGSAVFTDPGIPDIGLAPSDFTAPVTGSFPP